MVLSLSDLCFLSFSHSQPSRFKVPPALLEVPKSKHKHHHRHHHRKRRRGKGQEMEGFPPKKKLSTIFEPAEEDDPKTEEREHEISAITSDKDVGITFKTGAVRWTIGRQISEEESEREKQKRIREKKKEEEESSSSSSSDDDSSTGDELEKKSKLETLIEEPSDEDAWKEGAGKEAAGKEAAGKESGKKHSKGKDRGKKRSESKGDKKEDPSDTQQENIPLDIIVSTL